VSAFGCVFVYLVCWNSFVWCYLKATELIPNAMKAAAASREIDRMVVERWW